MAWIFAPLLVSLRSAAVPNYHGCVSPASKKLAYCNASKSYDARVASLVAALTLEEKIGLIAPDPGMGGLCFAHIHAIPRLELPEYGWLVEVNTGVTSQCLGPGQCATTFSGPTGLAASFNRSSWAVKGAVLSTEMRAFSNVHGHRGTSVTAKIATSAFGPNLNIIRDPRYGRNSELPGEDPYLTGEYGVQMVKAMQLPDKNGHPRVNAYLKHFDAYSTETNRMHSDFNVTAFDFYDTYLPQYHKVFTEANAAGAMCSYTSTNGVPSCANSWLLNTVLREQWGRADAVVTTDCGAVSNTMGPPLNLATKEEAAAAIINGGTDVEMGSSIWNTSMRSAVTKGLVAEATIDESVRRVLKSRMRQGDFDPVEEVQWTAIPASVINSSTHQAVAYDAALQSMVLLKNHGEVLPLKPGVKLAVVGPGALTQQGLVGPYFGDCICWSPHEMRGNYTYDCIPTVASQLAAANIGGTTTVASGISMSGRSTSGIAHALALVDGADVAVLVIGDDHSVEHEGHDVADITLPGIQEKFAQQVLSRNKPTVLVLLGNDGTGIDDLVSGSAAIVRAFYPATHGSKALASLLFGNANRWGKLPVTMYPRGYVKKLPKMGQHTGTAYAMSHGEGRSYRYYSGKPLFSFGTGLSYSNFSIACDPLTKGSDDSVHVSCVVTNNGPVVGDEVVMVFHEVGDSIRAKAAKLHPVPLRQLVDFARVGHLAPQASTNVTFILQREAAFSLTTASGEREVYSGEHRVVVSTGVPSMPDVILATNM